MSWLSNAIKRNTRFLGQVASKATGGVISGGSMKKMLDNKLGNKKKGSSKRGKQLPRSGGFGGSVTIR